MKRVSVVILLMLIGGTCFGQNWNEFFRQKRTQIRYLWQQIAALQVYIELGQKGYGIYHDGLTLIGDIKDGEFNLHKNYFASLGAVNPHIARMPEVAEIVQWHHQVILFESKVKKQDVGVEKASLVNLYNGIIGASKDNIRQLELLITSGNYQLKDEERLSQVKTLHQQQKVLYQFARSVYQDVFGLQLHKRKEQKDVKVINSFHGLN